MFKTPRVVVAALLAALLPTAVAYAQMPAPLAPSFGSRKAPTGAVVGSYVLPGVVELQVPPVVNPNGLEFPASPSHLLMSAGVAMLTRYTVLIATAAAPTVYLKTLDIGKPTPVAGKITCDQTTSCNGVDFTAVRETLTAGSYVAFIRAEGPGGSTLSAASDPFTVQALPPSASGKIVWK